MFIHIREKEKMPGKCERGLIETLTHVTDPMVMIMT